MIKTKKNSQESKQTIKHDQTSENRLTYQALQSQFEFQGRAGNLFMDPPLNDPKELSELAADRCKWGVSELRV